MVLTELHLFKITHIGEDETGYVCIYIYSCYIAFLSDPFVWYTSFRCICFIFWDVFHYHRHLTRTFCVYEIDFRYHHINPWVSQCPHANSLSKLMHSETAYICESCWKCKSEMVFCIVFLQFSYVVVDPTWPEWFLLIAFSRRGRKNTSCTQLSLFRPTGNGPVFGWRFQKKTCWLNRNETDPGLRFVCVCDSGFQDFFLSTSALSGFRFLILDNSLIPCFARAMSQLLKGFLWVGGELTPHMQCIRLFSTYSADCSSQNPSAKVYPTRACNSDIFHHRSVLDQPVVLTILTINSVFFSQGLLCFLPL